MDGVLIDAMPFHYKAMSVETKEIADIDLDKRTFYLLEGMPVAEMAIQIFRLKGYKTANNKTELAEKIAKRKKEVFKQMNVFQDPMMVPEN
jgi:beta-phosphoglucomutase